MTIPKDVQDAMDGADKCAAEIGGFAPWQTIRTHLLSQDAEIDRLLDWREAYESLRRELTAERDTLQSHLQGAGDEA